MTALDAFLPTLAALHRHVAAAATSPAAAAIPESHAPIILKYIIVQTPHGDEVPIIFPQSGSLSHADLVPPGCTPVSAGFCLFYHDQVTIPNNIPSSTLNLSPRPSDKSAIARLLNQ